MATAGAERIDVTFNVGHDAGGGDPDRSSPTLRRYHQLLWSKPLPDGTVFTLDAATPYCYLHHASAVGEFFLMRCRSGASAPRGLPPSGAVLMLGVLT